MPKHMKKQMGGEARKLGGPKAPAGAKAPAGFEGATAGKLGGPQSAPAKRTRRSRPSPRRTTKASRA